MSNEEACLMMEVPSSPRPGWDYYLDYQKHEWIHVADNDDMTWWLSRITFCPDLPDGNHLSGKEWKKIVMNDSREVFDFYI